jgi:hypothetical protein
MSTADQEITRQLRGQTIRLLVRLGHERFFGKVTVNF